jgi:hypothetical protein
MSTSDERKRELDKIKEDSKRNLKRVKEEEREANRVRLFIVKQQIRDNFKTIIEKPPQLGGQHCGMPVNAVIVKSEELEIEIKIKHFRGNHQNRELATLLMELAMDEIIR